MRQQGGEKTMVRRRSNSNSLTLSSKKANKGTSLKTYSRRERKKVSTVNYGGKGDLHTKGQERKRSRNGRGSSAPEIRGTRCFEAWEGIQGERGGEKKDHKAMREGGDTTLFLSVGVSDSRCRGGAWIGKKKGVRAKLGIG